MELIGFRGVPCLRREAGEGTEGLIPTLPGSSCLPTRVGFPPAARGTGLPELLAFDLGSV